MSNKTTVTVSKPLKKRLEELRDKHSYGSLNNTIKQLLDNPVESRDHIDRGDLQANPKPIKVEQYTLEWLRTIRDESEFNNYEDLLRVKAGCAPREHGEQPIDWEPL